MLGKVHFRKAVRFGPKLAHVQLNASKSGVSRTIRLLGFISHNNRTGKWRVDLPGPFSWSSAGKPRKSTK